MGSDMMKKDKKNFSSIDVNTIIEFQNGSTSSANKILHFYNSRIKAALLASYSTNNLGGYIGEDDLLQEAYLHFIDAAKFFKIERNINGTDNVSNFFNFCIKKTNWRLLDYVRLLSRRHCITNEKFNLAKDSEVTFENIMPDVIFQNALNKALSKLSNRDRIICSEMIETEVISEKTLVEVGLHKNSCSSIFRSFKKNLMLNIGQDSI